MDVLWVVVVVVVKPWSSWIDGFYDYECIVDISDSSAEIDLSRLL